MQGSGKCVGVRIEWGDLDAFGHVNNISIQRYVQAARVRYLESVGLMQSREDSGIGPILASTSFQFRKPLFYPGQVTVDYTVDQINNSSFRIRYAVYNDKSELAAEAQEIIVMFDYGLQSKLPIPDEVRERLQGTCGPLLPRHA